MKIAVTHDRGPDQTEPLQELARALESLGVHAEMLDSRKPVSQLAARLEASKPDLVLDVADRRGGEAFLPALLAQLGLHQVGPEAEAWAAARDRHLARLTALAHGVPTPRWTLVRDVKSWRIPEALLPAVLSSRTGIPRDGVYETAEELLPAVEAALRKHGEVLVEAWSPGKELVFYYLERAEAPLGVLPPPSADPSLAELALPFAQRMAQLLGLRDAGEIVMRVSDAGDVAFVEARPCAHLLPGSALYAAARAAGVGGVRETLSAVLESAAERHGIVLDGPHSRRTPLRVGLAYNAKRIVAKKSDDDDSEAEFDAPATIESLRAAIASHGHDVVLLEATPELPATIGALSVDVVFNIAEGMRGRNREAQIPALLELLDIEYTGSDPTALSLTLDKGLAKRIVRQAGVPTPDYFSMLTGDEPLPDGIRFPLIVKPIAEGSSKGVLGSNVAEDLADLRRLAKEITGKYRQEALVEEYLPGREFTVALLGEDDPRVLPAMEIVFKPTDKKRNVYSFEHKLAWSDEIRYDAPADVDEKLGAELMHVARTAFTALGCRDVARMDLRLDASGRVNFLECNPLPGLTPGWSDLCLIAKGVGMEYEALIGEILAPAIRRFRTKRRRAE